MITALITPAIAAKETLRIINWLRPDVVGRGDLAETFRYGRGVKLFEDQIDVRSFEEFSRCVCLPIACQIAWRFAATPPSYAEMPPIPLESATEYYSGVCIRVSATKTLDRWPSTFVQHWRFETMLGRPS